MPTDDNPQHAAPSPSPSKSQTPVDAPPPSATELDPQPAPTTTSAPQAPEPSRPSASESDAQQLDRTELLVRARSFLTSPQIQPQEISSKRRFLQEKGLTSLEIDSLLRELPVQMPLVPPRSYPRPPPSNLPNLLLGLFRLFTWLAGGSAAILFIYHRFLLPRLAFSFQARHSLTSHSKSLFQNLTASLSALKESQAKSFSVLPRPQLHKEEPTYAECHGIREVLAVSGISGDAENKEPQFQAKDIPEFSLLRCALEEFAKENASMEPSTEELFQVLETRIPWLATEDGAQYQNSLWKTLNTCPLFQHTEDESSTTDPSTRHWSYHAPTPPSQSPLLSSLSSLSSSFPSPPSSQETRPHQFALQSLADFTGYLTTQVYTFPFRTSGTQSPAEEELKREIRALKGLVLNRRSFMPAISRPASASSLQSPTP